MELDIKTMRVANVEVSQKTFTALCEYGNETEEICEIPISFAGYLSQFVNEELELKEPNMDVKDIPTLKTCIKALESKEVDEIYIY